MILVIVITGADEASLCWLSDDRYKFLKRRYSDPELQEYFLQSTKHKMLCFGGEEEKVPEGFREIQKVVIYPV